MRFNYEYRTSDNSRHAGVVDAVDEKAAYATLKAQGIRPSRLTEEPGFLNALLGKGKRWIAIAILALGVVAALIIASFARSELEKTEARLEEARSTFDDRTRRQPIGDVAIIEKGIKTGWSDIFEYEGERFLAGFAVPGVPVSVRNTTKEEIEEALNRKIELTEEDGLEARQIKAMVEGMKDELREFLAAGGTIVAYGRRLVRRQDEEIGYYTRALNELEQLKKSGATEQALYDLWEARNDKLRKMGIKLLAMPE